MFYCCPLHNLPPISQGLQQLTASNSREMCGTLVQAARNGLSLPSCVAKAEISTADRLGSREGSSRAGPPQGRGVSC